MSRGRPLGSKNKAPRVTKHRELPEAPQSPAEQKASAAERRLAAQVAVHTSWANTTDRTARAMHGVEARWRRYEARVDPDGVLPPAERHRRAEHLMRAEMARLALASAKARAKRRAS